jgi:cobalamin biosynthetic protein CobC
MLPKMRSASKIAMPSLMYQEHSRAWQRNGHEVIEFESYPDENIIKHADVVLLCNPNNPTSTRFNNSELLRWRTQLTERGGWLIVDEAFMDATPELSIAQHAHLEGLFVLRSLGKFFGLAGARVGFLLGSEKALIAAQEEIGPWSIPGPSRSIAEQALKNKAWQQATRINLSENSQRLIKMLTLYDLAPSSGTTLFQFKSVANAEVWHHHFAKQGIWVRLFREESALRFGLPPSFGWGRLENALKSFKHTS